MYLKNVHIYHVNFGNFKCIKPFTNFMIYVYFFYIIQNIFSYNKNVNFKCIKPFTNFMIYIYFFYIIQNNFLYNKYFISISIIF